jgi:hypothetical protein
MVATAALNIRKIAHQYFCVARQPRVFVQKAGMEILSLIFANAVAVIN